MKNPRRGSGDVFQDAGFSLEEAVELRFKAELYQAVLACARQYKPKQLEILFSEPQPRVSELLNGKIANKSIGKLLWYAGRLGIEPRTKFPQTRRRAVERELAGANLIVAPALVRLEGKKPAMAMAAAHRRTALAR